MMTTRGTFEISRVRELCEADPDFVREVLVAFLDQTFDHITKLNELIGGEDVSTIVRLAHTLKGSSLNLGALGLAEESRRLEEAGRRHDRDAMRRSFEGVAREGERLTHELRQLI